MNEECFFILRGDYNDCRHAGGGRGAKDAWCESCIEYYERETKMTHNNDDYPTTQGMTDAEVDERQFASRKVTVPPREPYKGLGNVLCQRFTYEDNAA